MSVASRNKGRAVSREDSSDAVSVHFSILGVGIHLEGGPAADVHPVTRLYAGFRDGRVNPSWAIEWDGYAFPTLLTVNGKVHPGLSRKWASPFISMKIMDCLYRSTEDFYLFHGAAAAWRDVLVALPGESGTGKSLLSIALAKSGWSLFSDEVVAVSRESLRVYPFGRAVMFRKSDPGLSDLLSDQEQKTEFMPLVGGGAKEMIPFSSLNKPPSPLPLRAIACLRGGRREVRRGGRQIVVTRWDKEMEKLAREKGIYENLQVRKAGELWCIRGDQTAAAEDVVTSLGGIVVERDLMEESPPAFGKKPLLKRISPSECLDALWSVFQNGRTLGKCEGGPVGLYLRLAELVRGIPCFWLRPGLPLPTCELLKNLAEKLTKRDACCE